MSAFIGVGGGCIASSGSQCVESVCSSNSSKFLSNKFQRGHGVQRAKLCCAHCTSLNMIASPELVNSASREDHLPYKTSIAGDEFKLLFMPFLVHQNEYMRETLDISDLSFEKDLSYQSSTGKKKARIESWCYCSPEFRKIRSTYIDAGISAQVWNSVWYPDPKYDLPLLGIDFLSFGKEKLICILDFQPLSQDPEYLEKYIDPVAAIKSKYPMLDGKMSARFYDENQFFSRQMAFIRSDNDEFVMRDLFPAFKEYLAHYISMIKDATPSTDPDVIAANLQRQKDYDQYSAERDPAVNLFGFYFGHDWAERFTHDFLFEYSVPVPKDQKDLTKEEKTE